MVKGRLHIILKGGRNMEETKQFEIILDKDIRKYQNELENYFQHNLNIYKTFCLDTEKIGIDEFYDKDVETKIYFTKPNNLSIYYACVNKSESEDSYVFGLASDITIKTSNYLDKGVRIKPEVALILNKNDNVKSNLIFARDCESKDVVLLLKIDCSELSDRECAVLEAKNHILVNEDNKKFINFGSICRKNQKYTLSHIRNFISNTAFVAGCGEYIKLSTIKIPRNFDYKPVKKDYHQKLYDKIITNINQDTKDELLKITSIAENSHNHKYCMLCGGLIKESYENKEELSSIVGDNPKKCSHCVEEILMSYFKSKVFAPYTNKSHLISDFKNKKVANFYLNLLNDNEVIDKGHKYKFIKPLSDQSVFFDEIPEDYLLESLYQFEGVDFDNIGKVISALDKETITGNFELLDGFKQRLSNNNLTESDGWIIRDMIIDLIKMGNILNIKQVNKKLKKLINDFDNLKGIDAEIYDKNVHSNDFIEGFDLNESIEVDVPVEGLENKNELIELFLDNMGSKGIYEVYETKSQSAIMMPDLNDHAPISLAGK